MSQVSFTIREAEVYGDACCNMRDRISTEKDTFVSAVEMAIGKFNAAKEMYSQSIDAMYVDEHEAMLVYEYNRKSIETLKGRLSDARDLASRSTEQAKTNAEKLANSLEYSLKDAERTNSDLMRLRDRLLAKISEYQQIIRTCESNISSLRKNGSQMEILASELSGLLYELDGVSQNARRYADRILKLLGASELGASYDEIRIKFDDIDVLLNLGQGLKQTSESLAQSTVTVEDASASLQMSMSDKISRAAVAKAREIEEDCVNSAKELYRLGRNAVSAYDCLCDYLNLKRTVR